MDIRYSAHPEDVKRYTTEELRKEFLIQNLYQPDTVQAVYSHVDRMVVLGIMPVNEALPIDKGIDVWANFGTNFFLERREAGVFNLGGAGWIEADGVKYELGFEDCLYISRSTKSVVFGSNDKEQPARFYLVSAPAHKDCKTTFISIKDANKRPCGSKENSNERVINQFIHPDVLETCQLSMGLTQLAPGSVWELHAPTPMSAEWRYTPTSISPRRGRPAPDGSASADPPPRHAELRGRHFPVMVTPCRLRHLELHLHMGDGRREPGLRRHGHLWCK